MILFAPIIILISLFTFGFENMAMMMFVIGSLSISFMQLVLVCVAFLIVNFLIMSVTSSHRSIIDIFTSTKQVDVTYFIEEKKERSSK